jgi:4-carboxymuconolactone decarboxylase
MTTDQRAAYDRTVKARGQVPGPYKIWLQNVALETAMVPIGVYFQEKVSLTRAEHEIVTNLTNGHWAAAAYTNYEHEEIGHRAGLAKEKVAALIAGLPVAFEDPREQIVHDVARTLIAGRRLPRDLFDRAVELLGHPGLTDVTVLIGYFTMASLTMVAYDVPSIATGLQR